MTINDEWYGTMELMRVLQHGRVVSHLADNLSPFYLVSLTANLTEWSIYISPPLHFSL